MYRVDVYSEDDPWLPIQSWEVPDWESAAAEVALAEDQGLEAVVYENGKVVPI